LSNLPLSKKAKINNVIVYNEFKKEITTKCEFDRNKSFGKTLYSMFALTPFWGGIMWLFKEMNATFV